MTRLRAEYDLPPDENAEMLFRYLHLAAEPPGAAAAHSASGRFLPPGRRTPEVIRDSVRTILERPSYRLNAERVQREIAELPGPDHAVTLLERLAETKQPILRRDPR